MTTDIKEKFADEGDIRAASRQLLGRDDFIDADDVHFPDLETDQFDKARHMAQAIHKEQFDNGFTNGAGLEVLSLLIGVELLGLHVKKVRNRSRERVLNAIIAKGLLHAKSLVDAYDAKKFRADKTRLNDGTVVDGEVIEAEPTSATRH